MRLTHVTLRNCRLHSQLQHEFSPGLNLIAGFNETGKSTLVESMHRALFLKSKGNTEDHRALIPTGGGIPEVELRFESGGREYVLRKRYAGASGSTTLAPRDSLQLSGEAAEKELEQLVGSSAAGNELKSRWAHVWVWQGQSGSDPTEHATANRDRLLARLQDLGGAAVIQSPTDTRLAAHFAEEAGRWFVARGKVKTDSPLGRSIKALETAERELSYADERWHRLETAFRDHEIATQAIALAALALKALEEDETENADHLRKLGALRAQEPLEIAEEQAARAAWDRIENAERHIMEVTQAIAAHQSAATSRIQRLEESRRNARLAREALDAAEVELQTVEGQVRSGRLATEWATAQLEQIQLISQCERARAQVDRVNELREQIAGLEAIRSALPAVDAKKLRRLRENDAALREAKASLQAMAAELKLIKSDGVAVRVGDTDLAPGGSTTVTVATEVQIGAVRLRLLPGGGSALDETRARVTRLTAELREALDALGLQGLSDAEDAGTRHEDLERQLDSLRGRMGELRPEQAAKDLSGIETGLTEVKAKIARLVRLVEPSSAHVPSILEAAQHQQERRNSELDSLEENLQEAKWRREAAAVRRNEHDQLERDLVQDNMEQNQLVESLRGQLQMLLSEHGDPATRARRQSEALGRLEVILAKRRATHEAIEALQPDLLAADQLRLQRARQEQSRILAEARERAATSRGVLIADGVADPGSELAVARLRRDQMSESTKNLRLHASAIALLHDLFQDEQQKLSASFTRPLAERLNGYLRCLFGPRAEAQVDYREGEFEGLRLWRPESGPAPMPFESLSGGTREQLATALRFAVAELLAADGDGSIPVVLDDAFAYSDPERVRGMIRMLDLATRRNLQVILLTCNSAGYQSLGARTLTLQRPVPGVLPAIEHPPEASAGLLHSAPDAPASEADYGKASPLPAPDLPASGDERRILQILKELGGSSGNQSLRDALGWSNERYDIVKARLIENGMLVPGRGRGGSVALAVP